MRGVRRGKRKLSVWLFVLLAVQIVLGNGITSIIRSLARWGRRQGILAYREGWTANDQLSKLGDGDPLERVTLKYAT